MAADVDAARVGLTKALIRAYEDPEYHEHLKNDPNAALSEFQLTTDDVELLKNTSVTMGANTCADTSCIVSLCPCTCAVTVPGIPGLCRMD